MAAYLEKARFSTQLAKQLDAKYPGIINDPQLFDFLHSGMRAMPRVQGTVKERYVAQVIKETGTTVRQKPITKENFKGEAYDTVEYV